MGSTKNELEVEEDIKLDRRMWTLERVGWAAMFLFLVAAVLGFMGKGGLVVSEENAGGPDTGLAITYDRYLRQDAPSKITVTFHSQRPEHQLRFNKMFIKSARIEQIVPEPSAAGIDSAGITYTFSTKDEGAMVILYFKPSRAGSLHTVVSDNATTLTLNQFVYP
ncbi:hypothetical protein I2I11_19610 [Pontibacter sp. 172403-2]|uniref:hypothetical protein n=1 Tax=Pontibacter rufus TaxID=2791028 RepID=UPI0018AFB595|nr:hypothetical protein [Pontibacter sp. 172403-2]MBF9255515.1 hypothetical protein [Pontibacter sp. 172403-2]